MARSTESRVPGEAQTETKSQPDEIETVTVAKGTLEAMQAQLDAMAAKLTKLDGARPVVRKGVQPDLPDQDGVDPDKIKTPVLTKQGWVVPTEYGAAPKDKRMS